MRPVIGNNAKTGSTKRLATSAARGSTTRNCRCGQQLDVCARAHCPRCGRTLSR